MSTFVCNQQVANSDASQLAWRQSWSLTDLEDTIIFPDFILPPHSGGPELCAVASGSCLQPCKELAAFQRVTDREGWTWSPCASLNNGRLPPFT